MMPRIRTYLSLTILVFLLLLAPETALCQNQIYRQGNTLNYPSYQSAQPQQYESYAQQPVYQESYQNYSYPNNSYPVNPSYQASPNHMEYQAPPVQTYKRPPRMQYQSMGHQAMPRANFATPKPYYHPPHYGINFKQQMMKALMGGGGGSSNSANNQGAQDRVYNQRSVALSQADSAEACADKASYGSRNSRKDYAYEARSHANRARSAAEQAQSAASSGGSAARGYAQDAWAAADRAQSAADRAESAANRGGGW